MKNKQGLNLQDNHYRMISRQLDLIMKLLAVIATDKDFSSYTQEHQIAFLGRMGFRNIEVAELMGVKRPNVAKAFKKYKVKRT
jgi:hypothetical protein